MTSALIFAVIGTLNACRDSRVKEENKPVKAIENSIKDINFEDVFTPVEEIEIDLKSEVTNGKTR